MKQLIKHLWNNNREEIISKSLLNCHVEGVHSIMLSECPGKTIRLYVAQIGNKLNDNFPEKQGTTPMSVGFHPHHCNLTLHCIQGELLNWIITPRSYGPLRLTHFEYQSKITKGELLFKEIGEQDFIGTSAYTLKPGGVAQMKASDIHTVACSSEYLSAWLVYEGKEDPDYKSYCWSNCDPNLIDTSNLYQPCHELEIIGLLEQCNLM